MLGEKQGGECLDGPLTQLPGVHMPVRHGPLRPLLSHTGPAAAAPHAGLPPPSPLPWPAWRREKLSSLAFNAAGDWIAVGSAKLGQLLVWEWRSETYVLKQQGHYYDVAASAYSPDGTYLATAADDAKVCGARAGCGRGGACLVWGRADCENACV